MRCLGEYMQFESAVGMNGIIWVKGRNYKETIAIENSISVSEHMTNEEITDMVAETMSKLK